MNDDPLPTSPCPAEERLVVLVTNRQRGMAVDRRLIQRAVRSVLHEAGVRAGQVGVAVVGDRTIRRLNRQFLDHDEPTDVLSFALEQGDGYLGGEIVVSAETAQREAARRGCSGQKELLWYVIHGALHLAGYDDRTSAERRRMRRREKAWLRRLRLGAEPSSATPIRSRPARGGRAARPKGGNARR